jgi:GT2 family glycosyltransferase
MIQSKSLCTVICAQHNRSNYTIRSLTSLFKSTDKEVDVIIIDSGSNLTELKHLHRYFYFADDIQIPSNFHIRFVQLNENISIGYNRNIGINMARTEWILSTDNDVEYTTNWLEKSIEYYNESNANMLGIWQHPHHQHICDVSENTHEMNNIPGNSFFSKRELYDNFKFKEVKSCDYSKELGEDTDMVWRMRDAGLKLFSVKNNLICHFGRIQSDGGTAVEFI